MVVIPPDHDGRDDIRETEPDAAQSPGFYGEYDENGVDLSLLRYTLRLSPLERLKVMERHARDAQLLYEYGRRHREAKSPSNR